MWFPLTLPALRTVSGSVEMLFISSTRYFVNRCREHKVFDLDIKQAQDVAGGMLMQAASSLAGHDWREKYRCAILTPRKLYFIPAAAPF